MVQNELYLTEPIQFLRTCTIKNTYLALMSRNNDVTPEFQDSLPEKLLPYYRHMRGEYILRDGETEVYGVLLPNTRIYTKFDTQMYVRSWDTTEEIELSRAQLEKHSKTAEWYRIPNAEYFKLCTKYPTQSDLIKNIVYPIPDDVDPTEAENFTLLNCDTDLLEENERVSIISAINKFLESVRVRWDVKEFCFEHLYPIAFQDVLWNQLYNCIMTQRILNIRTSSVCSYHIWEYLKSRGLKDYRDVLSKKKALFLYRNIDYLLQNQGTRKTFSILIGGLLSDLNITIDQKALVQKVNTVTKKGSDDETSTDIVVGKEDNCSPGVEILSFESGDPNIMEQARAFMTGSSTTAAKKTGNFTTAVLAMSDDTITKTNVDLVTQGYYETKKSIYDKEKQASLEYTNDNLFTMSTAKQDVQFPASPHSLLLTKIHEINADLGCDLYSSLMTFYITQALLYRSSLRHLDFAVHVNNNDDVDLWLMSGDELLALLFYSTMRMVGVTLKTPPERVFLKCAYLTEFPPIDETFVWNQRTYKTSDYLTAYGFSDMVPHPGKFTSPDYCDYILGLEAQNFLNNYIQMFYKPTAKGVEIFAQMMKRRMTYGIYNLHLFDALEYKTFYVTEDDIGKTVVINDKNIDITEENISTYLGMQAEGHYITRYTSYDDMFTQRPEIQVVIDKYNISDNAATSYKELFVLLLQSLFSDTGSSILQNVSMSDKSVDAMKELFKSMCSYNISFVDSSSSKDVIVSTLPCFPTESWEIPAGFTYIDPRFIPRAHVSMNMEDMHYSKMFGDHFFIAHQEDMTSVKDPADLHVDQPYSIICTDKLWNFTPVTFAKILYNTGENFGILRVDILLRLIRSLLFNEGKFYVDKKLNEFIFLRAQGCIIELDPDEQGIEYIKVATGTIRPGGVEMTVQEYLEQSKEFYENEEFEVAKMFARTDDWSCKKYEPIYYVQTTSQASSKTRIEEVNFIGYADSFDGLEEKAGNLVYINQYGTNSHAWIGLKQYIYYRSRWYEAIVETNNEPINIEE